MVTIVTVTMRTTTYPYHTIVSQKLLTSFYQPVHHCKGMNIAYILPSLQLAVVKPNTFLVMLFHHHHHHCYYDTVPTVTTSLPSAYVMIHSIDKFYAMAINLICWSFSIISLRADNSSRSTCPRHDVMVTTRSLSSIKYYSWYIVN